MITDKCGAIIRLLQLSKIPLYRSHTPPSPPEKMATARDRKPCLFPAMCLLGGGMAPPTCMRLSSRFEDNDRTVHRVRCEKSTKYSLLQKVSQQSLGDVVSAPPILGGERFTQRHYQTVHCKKRFLVFPSPAGMSLTKLSLAGKSLIIPAQGEFGK